MNLALLYCKRYMGFGLVVLTMVHTGGATTPSARQLAEFQQQYQQLVAQQKAHHTAVANTLLKSKPSVFDQINKKTIISDNERAELQFSDLVKVCGKPETSFGTKGLDWLLIPVSDVQEITRRQTIVKSLVEDKKLFHDLQQMLQEIEKSEASVLMYWDKQDALMLKFSQFYYTVFPFQGVNKSFNKSPLALNIGVIDSLWTHSYDFLMNTFLFGLILYVDKFVVGKKGEKFDFKKAMSWMFKEPFREINPNQSDPKEKDVETIFMSCWHGTAGDRFYAIKNWFVGDGNARPALVVGATLGGGIAALLAVKSLFLKYHSAKRAVFAITNYWTDLFMLRANLKQVATFIRSLEKFEKVISASPALAHAKTNKYLTYLMNKNNWSADLRKLAEIFESSMFNESQKLFLPGQIFAAHTLMQEVKGELVPAMQAIAEFDAYLSLAKMMLESQQSANTYSFVEFVQHETPLIEMQEVWTPFVGAQQAVSNPVLLGAAGNPVRMLITGPNGGGKSIYFTALGQAVLMAHSWGIVPARSARMTLFNQIRTSFAPKEDKLQGISKFMAQKRHISSIEQLIATSNSANKMLVLLDEPFDGTTEHLMAERVYEFGRKVTQLPHVVVGIATHVKKPIELAHDGSFKNYHVGIEEPELGIFERTFKLEEGPADWWFADQKRGARYQDWLDLYMQRRAMSKVAKVA